MKEIEYQCQDCMNFDDGLAIHELDENGQVKIICPWCGGTCIDAEIMIMENKNKDE